MVDNQFNSFRESILAQISGLVEDSSKSMIAMQLVSGAAIAMCAIRDERYLPFTVQLAALNAAIVQYGWTALQAEISFSEAASEEEAMAMIEAMRERPDKLN